MSNDTDLAHRLRDAMGLELIHAGWTIIGQSGGQWLVRNDAGDCRWLTMVVVDTAVKEPEPGTELRFEDSGFTRIGWVSNRFPGGVHCHWIGHGGAEMQTTVRNGQYRVIEAMEDEHGNA